MTETKTKKILYVDMDNTLVDFKSGIDQLAHALQIEYKDKLDEVPGIFALMKPLDGAVEAFEELSKKFDIYILSTAPWKNPSAWQHKVEWVHLHFGTADGTVAHKRLILSHHKNLNRGHFLVDDRPNNGASEFEGEWIQFDSDQFPDWKTVTDYLLARAEITSVRDLSADERAEQVARAKAIAVAAHTGQPDKLGVDYIQHPAAVSRHFDAKTQTLEHCAAWLHDVIEDTPVKADRLLLAGVHPEVVEVVELLTRAEGAGDEYYERIAAHPAARAVKYADITHNTDPSRTAQLDEDTRAGLREKYEHALDVLGLEWPNHPQA
ncbi:5' nucleotidase, NT5C type [Microbacterium sp. P5_E9]